MQILSLVKTSFFQYVKLIKQLLYSGNLLREEIFVNLAILLSAEICLITSYAFSLDNMNPKIYASFYFC